MTLDLDLHKHVDLLERTLIERAMDAAEGNKSEAARLLKIKRTTLIEKIRALRENPEIDKLIECNESIVILVELYEWEIEKLNFISMALEKRIDELRK